MAEAAPNPMNVHLNQGVIPGKSATQQRNKPISLAAKQITSFLERLNNSMSAWDGFFNLFIRDNVPSEFRDMYKSVQKSVAWF